MPLKKRLLAPDHNVIYCVDRIKERHPDAIILGDYARGYYTKCFSVYDAVHIITNHSDVLTDLTIIARQRQFNIPDRLKGNKSIDEIALICAKDDTMFFESETTGIGYLTADEVKAFGTPDDRKIFMNNVVPPIVPELASSVFYVRYLGARFYIHLVKDIPLNEYIFAANTHSTIFDANKCWMQGNDFFFASNKARQDCDDRIVTIPELVYSETVDNLAHAGWKLFYNEHELSFNAYMENVSVNPTKKSFAKARITLNTVQTYRVPTAVQWNAAADANEPIYVTTDTNTIAPVTAPGVLDLFLQQIDQAGLTVTPPPNPNGELVVQGYGDQIEGAFDPEPIAAAEGVQ